MDIFATALKTGGLILKHLDARSAYSDEAKSLKIRFDWYASIESNHRIL
jgi:hypothetical protein